MSDERYRELYSSSVTFAGVLGTSISIFESFSFQSALAVAWISSNDELPTSDSAFAQAWSVDTKETPTRMLTCSGVPSYENSAPLWYTPPIRLRVRFKCVWPRPLASSPKLKRNEQEKAHTTHRKLTCRPSRHRTRSASASPRRADRSTQMPRS